MDEMTITGTSYVAEADNGEVTTWTVEPEDVGLARAGIEDINGGANVSEAADLVRSILSGTPGARLDMVLLNSGAALMAAGWVDTLQEGVETAREIIRSGKALEKLNSLVGFCEKA
jgi:anthranilate phosphoribosyltransferase